MRSRPSAATAVFPVSDRSQSVLDALERFLRAYHVRILPRKAAEIAVSDGRVTGVKTAEGPLPADCVVLATGGLSYPATGSTGSGYAMAQAIGHTIIEPTGSLVPLVEKGHDCAKMQGLALKNIAVKLVNTKGKTVYEDFGELLFTHFGLSGPVILSASAHMARGRQAIRSGSTSSPHWTKKRWTRAFCAIFPPRRTAILKTAFRRFCRDP